MKINKFAAIVGLVSVLGASTAVKAEETKKTDDTTYQSESRPAETVPTNDGNEITLLDKPHVETYSQSSEFIDALVNSDAKRVFISSPLYSLGLAKASFVDNGKVIHTYQSLEIISNDTNYNTVDKINNSSVYSRIKSSNVPIIEGEIRLLNEEIYSLFYPSVDIIPETMGIDTVKSTEKYEQSYTEWLGAVKDLPIDGTVLQYVKDDLSSAGIIDGANGNQHHVFAIDGTNGRTIENVLKELSKYKSRDVTSDGKQYLELLEGPLSTPFKAINNGLTTSD